MRLAIACLVCMGCDQVFLDGPREITIAYDRDVIGTAGVVNEPYDAILEAHSARERSIDIERIDERTSRMETAGFYRLHYASAFADNALWANVDHVHVRERVLGRVARTPVPAGTIIRFPDVVALPGKGLGTFFTMWTTGQWTGSPNITVPDPLVFDFRMSRPLSGPLSLLDDPTDVVTLAEYGGGTIGSDYYEIVGALSRQGTVTSSLDIRGTLTAPPRDGCIAVTAQRRAILTRLSTIAPASYSLEAANWVLSAIPHEAVLGGNGPLLAFEGSTTDQDRIVRFANPFGGVVRASAGIGRIRTYHRTPSDMGVLLRYGMDVFARPVPGTACEPVLLAGDEIALVTSISLDGATLVRDDTVVAADRPLTVSWQVTAERVDYFSVAVVEIDASTGTQTVAYRYLTTEHEVVLPRGALVAGRQYYVGVGAVFGAPNAKDGDFATYTWPLISADASSGVFTVE